MRFSNLVGFLLPVAALGEELVIPAVQEAVKSQLEQYSSYVEARGAAIFAEVTSPADYVARDLEERAASGTYWYETIAHKGISAFNPNPSTYPVYRNVKSYGAKGDGKTDDTAAIQAAIAAGNGCRPGSCGSSTTTNAVVYFPAGTYLVSSSIVMYYSTNLVGNPNNMPVLKATAGLSGFGVIDGAQYQAGGVLPFGGSTNIFWRQVKNFVIDMTAVPASSAATGIHWPTAQATSLQNIVFKMSDRAGTQHTGIFVEEGSGGFMNDLVFYGGLNGAIFGNQQFTVRNLTFYGCVTAITQNWDWGWTYKSISVNNCTVGLDMATRKADGSESVGSVTMLDSSFTDTDIAFNISRKTTGNTPKAGGGLSIENIALKNVGRAIQHGPTKKVLLAGTTGSKTVASWVTGNVYHPNGPNFVAAPQTAFSRPASLLTGSKFYERSKPSYADLPSTSFSSVRSAGAKGDGKTDDTAALQSVLNAAAKAGRVVYFDAGTYRITKTLVVPAGSKIVGEAFPVIMSSGSTWSNIKSPKAVVQVGTAGQSGTVEWSDMVVSTQGAQGGAVLIEWNLASPAASPSGMWDVHTRVGGFTGSQLSIANCPTTPSSTTIKSACISGNLAMHVTKSASGLYMENVWLWTADHDIDDAAQRRVTVYAGRGLLVESAAGNIWLVGTSVEHHQRYQYNFYNTKNIFAGQIQTETPYYQPNPAGRAPYPLNTGLGDPNFDVSCPRGKSVDTCAEAWGLSVKASHNVLIYGAGLYSFFNNYSTSCSDMGAGTLCQTGMVLYDKAATTNLRIHGLNTVGAVGMVYRDTVKLATYSYNINVFPSTIQMFSSAN